MAATSIGLALEFGAPDDGGFVVRAYEESVKCDPIELLDGAGTFQAVAFSNPNSSANITLASASASGSIGSAFSFTGNSALAGMAGALYIDSCSKTLTNDGFAEVQISASGWDNLGQAT